ncbi:cystathionine beta-synthase [Holotrichia oblita]|nr:cystathionine beta-synthase [Holotrichia oblita]
MAKIYNNITELIGRTPLLELSGYIKQNGLVASIAAKLEYFNPAGSVKDRIAWAMVRDAEQRGILKAGSVIIEPTSGNTGVGLAAVAAARGYKLILVMPETMSIERRKLAAAYGAEIVLTEGAKGMRGAVDKAAELAASIPNSFVCGQFDNMVNPLTHTQTTGAEIWEDTDGKVDIFVSAVGTGGTISGVGRFLKSKNPNIEIVAVEPSDSPLLSKGVSGPHKIQGIGTNFVPNTLNQNIYDRVVGVSTDEAFEAARCVAKTDGILVGISSGAALAAAGGLAKLEVNRGKLIVVMLPDTGERYLSTPLFD